MDYIESTAVLAVAIICLAGFSACRCGDTAQEELPRSWRLLDGFVAPDESTALECRPTLAHETWGVRSSQNEWHVFATPDEKVDHLPFEFGPPVLQKEIVRKYYEENASARPSSVLGEEVQEYTPSDVEQALRELHRFGRTRRVLPIGDGFLVGYDDGEFGGALWRLSQDGSERELLLDGAVFALFRTKKEIVAVISPAQRGKSAFYKIGITAKGWATDKWIELPGNLAGVGFHPDIGLVVVNGAGVVLRIDESGATHAVAQLGGFFRGLAKIQIVDESRWFIGGRRCLFRLSKVGNDYNVECVLPPNCG